MTAQRATAASRRTFATRLALVLALLLLAYGTFVALLGRALVAEHEEESLQRLSHGLARHIIDHWPQFSSAQAEPGGMAARAALMSMLMTVNPAVQVYVLDADGRVDHYIGEPGMVRQTQVDLAAVRAFLAGAALPLRGTDPMGSAQPRIFSAAMFPRRPGDTRPPGYLYVVLDGRARAAVADGISPLRYWHGAAWVAAIGLGVTVLIGLFTFRRLTLPLHRLAARLHDYSQRAADAPLLPEARPPPCGDEVQAIDQAFVAMTERIESNAEREQQQVAAHRELMASVAHDLRTPLNALHGHLEALASEHAAAIELRPRLLAAALAQSSKLGRLSQQLFEMASLQATEQVLHRERFRLDELVADAVHKFDLTDATRSVMLGGVPPGRLEFNGDLQLIERALTNLIDNALRHAPGSPPVCVSVRRAGSSAEIWVEDAGPGLPAELQQRLDHGLSLREPPMPRSHGGIGGLGLAIAQRVAVLHGGSLRPLPAPHGGTRLCLALPLAV
jgi:signal transduction histidine kinase